MAQGKESKIDLDKVVAWIMSLGLKRALVGAFGIFVMVTGAGLAGLTAYGKAMASEVAQELVRPVTDTIAARVSIHDTLIFKMLEMQQTQAKIQEISISAQRQAFPKYDSALQRIAADRAAARRYKMENRDLIRRLTDSTSTPYN